MRLASFIDATGAHLAGEVVDEHVVAFEDGRTVLQRLRDDDRRPARGPAFPLEDVTLLAPLQPRCIFGVGFNFRTHAAETGAAIGGDEPLIFFKCPASVAPPYGEISRHGSSGLDYEAELAVIIGHETQIAGFAVANDVSARDWQRADKQWWRAKGADSFCPIGPWITTADEITDPYDLRLRSWVNGELRQEANTSELIFSFDRLIEFISAAVMLQPGDVILTGTPAGVGASFTPPRYLQAGDVVHIEVERLGLLENRVVDI